MKRSVPRGEQKLQSSVAAPAADPGQLAGHRAIYELKLSTGRNQSHAVSARGRILYDFSGNACEGYKLEFRQVSELDNGEGRVTLSDLRTNSWEDGAAKGYTFSSQNYVNQRLAESVDGRADRQADARSQSRSPNPRTASSRSIAASPFRPSMCGGSSRPRERTRPSWNFPSMTARKPATRSTTR